jgi:hypothetical protein
VGDAGFIRLLFARARADPDSDRHAADLRHSLGDDANAIGEHVTLDFTGLMGAVGHLNIF